MKSPANATVTWSVTGSTTFLGSNPGDTIVINNNENEAITLTATVSTSCGNQILTKQITVGVPEWYNYGGISGPGNMSTTNYEYFSVTPYPGATDYQWSINDAPPGADYSFNTTAGGIYFGASTPGCYIITCSAITECGNVTTELVTCVEEPYSYSYLASPNPSDNELRIAYKPAGNVSLQKFRSDTSSKEKSFEVKLLNDKGQVLGSGKSIGGEDIVIDTRDIQNGIYFLHIKDEKKVKRQQIIIKH